MAGQHGTADLGCLEHGGKVAGQGPKIERGAAPGAEPVAPLVVEDDPAQTANGMVVIVISLLMAATQTRAAGIDQVLGDVESVLRRRRPPAPLTRRREPIRRS